MTRENSPKTEIESSGKECAKKIIKQCHCCGHIHEETYEVERCHSCKKSFLPIKYFEKIHDHHQNYSDLFSRVEEIEEKDLIKGLIVLW
jgi:hypothetical protein